MYTIYDKLYFENFLSLQYLLLCQLLNAVFTEVRGNPGGSKKCSTAVGSERLQRIFPRGVDKQNAFTICVGSYC
jgi:hypothetical protein